MGVDFYVCASFTERVGWTVHSAMCHEGVDVLQIPDHKFRFDQIDDRR
jgi:hypothetical protein